MSWKALHSTMEGVTAGEARSVNAPIVGTYFPIAGGASPDVVLDLSELKGHYVRISVEDRDALYVFMSTSSGAMDTAATFDPKTAVPDIIWGCTSVREVVPSNHPYLHIRSKDDVAAMVRVRRA